MVEQTGATRREFLRAAASAIAVPYVTSGSALGGAGETPASERIRMGFIGLGGQGAGHLLGGAWTYVPGGYVARNDGAGWTTYDAVDLLGHGVGAIAVTPDGALWGNTASEGVVRFDGETWTRYSDDDGLPAGVRELVVAPDGVLWAAGRGGLARLDGDRWVRHEADICVGPLAFGQDGTIWLGMGSSLVHLRP